MQSRKLIATILLASCSPCLLPAQHDPASAVENQQQIQTLAVVNGQEITRQTLATECTRRFGEEVMESVINKQLVYAECQAKNIVITEKDVNDEIVNRARKFNMSDERYIKLITEKRNIPVNRFKNDIIWSELALRRLAATELQVTSEEIEKRMEFEFGPKVQVREIVVASRERAEQILQQVKAAPQNFGRFAKEHSINTNSASVSGLLPYIRRNSGLPQFENVAFSLQPGEISDIIEIEGRFIILQGERHEPAVQLAPEQLTEVHERIISELRNDKLAAASTRLFKKLQETVKITNVMNDPVLSKQMPGVAATVNQSKISKRFLAEECIARFGHQMLETEINRLILMQALQKNNLQVTKEDLEAEVARVALDFGYGDANNQADVERWLNFRTQKDPKKIPIYYEDEVWPSVALRKLVQAEVEVTQEDLKKGFEANYGERVETLAIVLSEHRMANKVWSMAQNNLNKKYFGELANQYSVEPLSRNNHGQVPPIQQHGGRPKLEEKAFALNAGELSEIVQVGEHWIILYCLGRTTPVVTDFEAVREELQKNIFQRKLEVAMADKFNALRNQSQIDNFLAGTSQSGRNVTGSKPSPTAPRR